MGGSPRFERDVCADAVGLAGQAGHLVQLAKTGKATPLFAIAYDLEAMAAQTLDVVEILGGRGVQIDQAGVPS